MQEVTVCGTISSHGPQCSYLHLQILPLGALRQQQQQQASTLAVNSRFLRVVGRTRRKKTRSRALSAGKPHYIGLYPHTCTSKCAAGSPTTAAAAAGEHLCTVLALFAGCGAHKTQKTRSRALSAEQSDHMGLYAHISTSKCAAGSPATAAAAAREYYGHARRRGHVTAARCSRPNTAQTDKSESQRTSPGVWASSPPGVLMSATPHGLAAALRSKEGEIQRSLLNGQARQHAAKCTR